MLDIPHSEIEPDGGDAMEHSPAEFQPAALVCTAREAEKRQIDAMADRLAAAACDAAGFAQEAAA